MPKRVLREHRGRKVINMEKLAIYTNKGDIAELVEKVERGHENREGLSRNCLSYVKEHSMDSTIEKLLNLYNSLVG